MSDDGVSITVTWMILIRLAHSLGSSLSLGSIFSHLSLLSLDSSKSLLSGLAHLTLIQKRFEYIKITIRFKNENDNVFKRLETKIGEKYSHELTLYVLFKAMNSSKQTFRSFSSIVSRSTSFSLGSSFTVSTINTG